MRIFFGNVTDSKLVMALSPEAVEEEWKVIDEMELVGKQQLREIDSS